LVADQAEPQFNRSILLLKQGKEAEACVNWFIFKSIRVDETKEFFSKRINEILENGPPPIKIPSHVCQTLSRQQDQALTLHLLRLWAFRVKPESKRLVLSALSSLSSSSSSSSSSIL